MEPTAILEKIWNRRSPWRRCPMPCCATMIQYHGLAVNTKGAAKYDPAGIGCELSPLFNDPYFKTIGLGTRIFLGGGIGYVTWSGSQHKGVVKRTGRGVPLTPAGTLFVMGELKQMSPKWLVGVSIQGYGASLAVGLGIPIPILNEEMVQYTAISE